MIRWQADWAPTWRLWSWWSEAGGSAAAVAMLGLPQPSEREDAPSRPGDTKAPQLSVGEGTEISLA